MQFAYTVYQAINMYITCMYVCVHVCTCRLVHNMTLAQRLTFWHNFDIEIDLDSIPTPMLCLFSIILWLPHIQSHVRTYTVFISHLFIGMAVQTTEWEVPALICCTWTPSSPCTLVGVVMDPLLCPCPHWPMLLVPQAYTSPPTIEARIFEVKHIICI